MSIHPITSTVRSISQTDDVSRVDPVERILNLLTLLHESEVALSRAEIVEQMAAGSTPYPADPAALHQLFSSDRRTITAGLGVVIHQRVRGGEYAGQTEYWVDSSEIRLPDLDLDDDERLVLALALATVSRSVPQAGEAQLKLGTGWIGEAPLDLALDVPDPVVALLDAIRSSQVVEILPGPLEATAGAVVMAPTAVVLSQGAWFAIGCGLDGPDTPIAQHIDAICTVTMRADRFPRCAPLDETTVEELLGRERSAEIVATVRVDAIAAVRASLSDRVISRISDGDEVLMEVRIDDMALFRDWLFSLGHRAIVEQPPSLRDQIAGWLQDMVTAPQRTIEIPEMPADPGRRPGPEPVAQRLHRLLAIVPWLYRQRSVRVAEIAERVGASVRQVVRDLTLASMCGLPPYTSDSLYGFWVETDPDTSDEVVNVLHPNLLVDAVRLTTRQAASVAVALAALEALGAEPTDAVARLRTKLDAALGGADIRIELEEPPLLGELRAATEQHRQVRIGYVDLDDEITERVVDPLKLFVDRGHAYVITDDHLRGAERVFRVDRVISIEPTGATFAPRPVTPPAGRVWEWMIPDRQVVIVVPPGCDWVRDRYAVAASVTLEDGSMVLWLSVVSDSWLASLLIRCGAGAQVLAPPEMAGLSSRLAAELADRYR